MSDDAAADGASSQAGPAAQPAPQIRVLSQYAKDVSFESPRQPRQLPHTISSPQIGISVNVNATPLDEQQTRFEVELKLDARATKEDEIVFIVEVVYAAVIELVNVSNDIKQPLTLIEGPRMIFPFARRIIADLVRDGGFPPMLIEPIDFAALYRNHLMQQQAAGSAKQ